jgi:hypothetical protein
MQKHPCYSAHFRVSAMTNYGKVTKSIPSTSGTQSLLLSIARCIVAASGGPGQFTVGFLESTAIRWRGLEDDERIQHVQGVW